MSDWKLGPVRGLALVDAEGAFTGMVEDTYPFDGGPAEFAVVRVGRFAERVMVPLAGASRTDRLLQVPYSRTDIEDSPALESVRYLDDAVSRSRGYWSMLDNESPGALAELPLAGAPAAAQQPK